MEKNDLYNISDGDLGSVVAKGLKRNAEDIVDEINKINDIIGIDEYPVFSESTAYSAGDVVNYNGILYQFSTDHSAGAWTGTDVEETDIVKAHIVQELGTSENVVMSQKAVKELASRFSQNVYTTEYDLNKVIRKLFIDTSNFNGNFSLNGLHISLLQKMVSGGNNGITLKTGDNTLIGNFFSNTLDEVIEGTNKGIYLCAEYDWDNMEDGKIYTFSTENITILAYDKENDPREQKSQAFPNLEFSKYNRNTVKNFNTGELQTSSDERAGLLFPVVANRIYCLENANMASIMGNRVMFYTENPENVDDATSVYLKFVYAVNGKFTAPDNAKWCIVTVDWTTRNGNPRIIDAVDERIDAVDERIDAVGRTLIYSDDKSEAVKKLVNLANLVVKRLYISPDDYPSNVSYDENGNPKMYFNQILNKYSDNATRIRIYFEKVDSSVSYLEIKGDNYLDRLILGFSPSKKSCAVLDFRHCDILYPGVVQPLYDLKTTYKIDFSILEQSRILVETDVEKLTDSPVARTTLPLMYNAMGDYNTGEIYVNGRKQNLYCGAFRVTGNTKYRIKNFVCHPSYNNYLGCYSDYPTIDNWNDTWVGAVMIDSDGYFTTKANAKYLLYVTNSNNAEREVTLELATEETPVVEKGALSDYTLYTIGDSLTAGGTWQTKVVEKTGINFDQDKNTMAGASLSVGGTQMGGVGKTCGFLRTKILLDKGYIQGDGDKSVVIFQNVNDGAFTFDKTKRTYQINKIIQGGLTSDFNESFLQSIQSEDRDLNAALELQVQRKGKILTINTLPTKEGDVTIMTGWSGPGKKYYNIHVIPQEDDDATMTHIIEKILEYDYTGVTDIEGSDGKSVIFSCGSDNYDTYLTFTDTGNTGMSCSISETNDARNVEMYYFNGDNLTTDWENTAKWSRGINVSSAWKSSIEMLQKAYPKLHIFVAFFPVISQTAADYLLSNGLYDSNAFEEAVEETHNKETRYNAAKGISDYYSLPLIDVWNNWGVGINNLLTYYNASANVHPKTEGYNRIGEVIARQLMNYLL